MKVWVLKIEYGVSANVRSDIIDILGVDFMYNRLYDFCDIYV